MKRFFAAAAFVLAAQSAHSAECITNKANFNSYKQTLAGLAQSSGVGQRGLNALANAKLSGITWRFESNPSNQTGTLQSDPARFLSKRSGGSADAFIKRVSSKVASNRNTFNAIEQRFGVPASLLATIWGLETSWGGYLGKTPVVSGAVTLSSYCRRHPKFQPHTIAALQMIDAGMVSPQTGGGPSGELGHMQFLAGNWLRFRVDGNGDGRTDPYNAVDALATAANMLRQNGWRAGQPFGEGTRNYEALKSWNDSGNYLRAIVYAAQRAG
ncbi:lytic murein transglycosylase [Planktotalea sp.]|uniref:lytic murein transglycosylase n=1 Tax=Planktotalea sp. TaxID=2029877 RepID=UPI0032989811